MSVKAVFGEDPDASATEWSAFARPSCKPTEAERGVAKSGAVEASTVEEVRGRVRSLLKGSGKIYKLLVHYT